MWRSRAEAEGLTRLEAENKAGYFGVRHHPGRPNPYEAQVRRGGKKVCLGSFATAEEAALCVARSPEGRAAAKKAAAAPLTGEQVRQQAEAQGLTLLKADTKARYFGVNLNKPGQPKPFAAQVSHGGKRVHLGSFATAEEAALAVARSPEGQVAAVKSVLATMVNEELPALLAEGLTNDSEEALQQALMAGRAWHARFLPAYS